MTMLRITTLLPCLLSALLLSPSLLASTPRDPGEHFFQETFGNYKEELESAREDNKSGVLVFFEMDDCPFCHRMKTTILNQPEVQDWYREHFRIFSLDIEGDIEMTDFKGNHISQKDFAFKEHRVRATPVIAFFDLNGNLVARYTGATKDAKEFLLLGQFVVDKAYEKTNFTSYKRTQKTP
jgi:thioredoxin-related protein